MFIWLSVAAGGALGAVLRHGVNIASAATWGTSFPFATMIVNILGSLILGVLTAIFAHYYNPSPEVKAFLVTGLLGAFTTFSTLSLDTITLFERGQYEYMALYILGSFTLGVGAFFLGLMTIRILAA